MVTNIARDFFHTVSISWSKKNQSICPVNISAQETLNAKKAAKTEKDG